VYRANAKNQPNLCIVVTKKDAPPTPPASEMTVQQEPVPQRRSVKVMQIVTSPTANKMGMLA
jgi:hypothetical protein